MTFDQVMAKLYPKVRGPYLYRRSAGIRGIGDCTPSSCPDGPYAGNDSANYDYWLNQTSTPDQEQAGQQTQPITTAAIEQIQQQSVPLMSYYDLLAQANLQNCDPRDSACVANNVSRQAAVEQFWVSHNEKVPVGTQLSFAPLSTAQVNDFYSATNPYSGGNVVDTSGVITSVSSSGASAAPPPKPNQTVPPTTPLTPMNTGIQRTGQVLQTQAQAGAQQSAGAGAGADSGGGVSGGSASGSGSNTLLIVAAVGVGLFLLMKGAK